MNLDINGYISNRSKSVFTITSSSDCKVQISNSAFKNNTCYGMGMFSIFILDYNISSTHTFDLHNCTFSRNMVESEEGGVVYIKNNMKIHCLDL